MKQYLKLLAFSRPYRSYLPWFIVCCILSVVFEIFNISLIAPILEVLFSDKPVEIVSVTEMPSFELSEGYFDQLVAYLRGLITQNPDKIHILLVICILLIISVFLSNFFLFCTHYVLAFVKGKMIRKVRMAMYKKMNQLPLSYFNSERRGEFISRMTNDIQEVEVSIVSTLHGAIKEPIKIIIYFIFMLSISTKLFLFSLVVLPISGLAISSLTKKLRRKATQTQDYLGKILNTIDETLGAMKIIYSFNAQSKMTKKFENENKDYERTFMSMDYKRALASPLSQFLGVIVFCVVMYYGGTLVLQHQHISNKSFLTFIFLFASVISPIKAISSAVTEIQRGLVAGKRIFEILEIEEIEKDIENAKSISSFQDKIELKNLNFAYDEKPILKNINLTLEKGKTIALVGPSGGGKSTLIDLIPRFFKVDDSQIFIDGNDINSVKRKELRDLIGVVTQESILFNDTIINNIKFGKPDASMEEVIQAAKIANAHDFIEEKDEQYDFVIGERGSKLSGGQRQRLSIARAILKNPPILLLDEATSALDTESEKLVQDALNNLMKERTSLVIAHRLSTIQQADLIVVIKEGEIIERGTHQELLDSDGFYKHLVEIQG